METLRQETLRHRVVGWLQKVSSMSIGTSYPAFFASIVLVVLAGCTVTRPIQLYPVNPLPSETAVLPGVIVGHGQGHGSAQITMPDGEILVGQYAIGFGESSGTIYSAPGNGYASLVGPNGTSMQCEFLNNNMIGHGSGSCRSSKGSLYRMSY